MNGGPYPGPYLWNGRSQRVGVGVVGKGVAEIGGARAWFRVSTTSLAGVRGEDVIPLVPVDKDKD